VDYEKEGVRQGPFLNRSLRLLLFLFIYNIYFGGLLTETMSFWKFVSLQMFFYTVCINAIPLREHFLSVPHSSDCSHRLCENDLMKRVLLLNTHYPWWCSVTVEANYPPHKSFADSLETGFFSPLMQQNGAYWKKTVQCTTYSRLTAGQIDIGQW